MNTSSIKSQDTKNPPAWELFFTPASAIEALYSLCEGAHKTIDIEQYIFADDAVGRRFIAMLCVKARAGVRVRLLCDAIGSFSLDRSETIKNAEKCGVQVRFFNRVKWLWLHQVFKFFLRTHRKLLIIDGKIAATGGVGIRENPLEKYDAHIVMRGTVAAEMSVIFEKMWAMTGRGKRSFSFDATGSALDDFRILTNSPRFYQRFTYWSLIRSLRAAKQSIFIETPYFIPDGRMLRAIRGAARRGVDVRVHLPGISDWRMALYGNQSFYTRLLTAGVKVFESTEYFNHAKVCIIDESQAFIGSSNLDSMSLLLNYEADIFTVQQDCVRALEQRFLEREADHRRIQLQEWRQRPWWRKGIEQLLRPLHRLF
jgi:cardiolipin synthase